MNFEDFMIPVDSWVKPRDLNDKICNLYGIAKGCDPLSRKQLWEWKNALGFVPRKSRLQPYRGYEYNQFIYMIEGLLKTGSISDTVEIIQELISEGSPYVTIQSQDREPDTAEKETRTIDI